MSITQLATVYATDEDVAVRASGDYSLLVPKDQKYASGSDGSFPAAAGGSWVLTSASSNFGNLGVTAGMIAQLTLSGRSELLAIDAVSGTTITLRRKGVGTGKGLPPGVAAGATGIVFAIQTLAPQIEEASYELNRQFGVAPTVTGRKPSDLFDARELRDATVSLTLHRIYLAQARSAGEKTDDFAAKAAMFCEDYEAALNRLVLHWNSTAGYGGPLPTTTTRFGKRISR